MAAVSLASRWTIQSKSLRLTLGITSMIKGNISKILGKIGATDKVLDIGGWAQPFNRANYVLDLNPWRSRGMFGSYGPEPASFTESSWLQRDICERIPYPFPDKFFDFVICSHTLEDVRDPIFVCSEINRIGKSGYIEVPSMRNEMTLGVEHPRYGGRAHHRWLVEIDGNEVTFTFKYHHLHFDWRCHFPKMRHAQGGGDSDVQALFWDGEFTFRENVLVMQDDIDRYLTSYVKAQNAYPSWRYALHDIKEQIKTLLR